VRFLILYSTDYKKVKPVYSPILRVLGGGVGGINFLVNTGGYRVGNMNGGHTTRTEGYERIMAETRAMAL